MGNKHEKRLLKEQFEVVSIYEPDKEKMLKALRIAMEYVPSKNKKDQSNK